MSRKNKIAFLMQESRMGGIEYNSIHLAKFLGPEFEVTFLCPAKGKLTDTLDSENLKWRLYDCPRFLSTSTKVGKGHIFNPFTTFYNFAAFFFFIFPLARVLNKNNKYVAPGSVISSEARDPVKMAKSRFLRSSPVEMTGRELEQRIHNIPPRSQGEEKVREKFDLIFTKGLLANFYGSLAARLAGVPVLWDMQEIVEKKKCFGLMSWILDRWAYFFTDGLIVPSEAIQNQFSAEVQEKCHKVPNGIDTDQYHPGVDASKVRNEWGIQPDEILIGHIARFTYWKGQKDFLQAAHLVARQFPKARFVLVGSPVFEDDAYEKEVKELAKNLGLNGRVLFPGFRDDLADVMAALDIFVHSSIEPEGCPITLITAMSMGKPVVATNVLGNNEIIDSSEKGILVSPGMPESLAGAISKIICDGSFADKLRKGSRDRILERYVSRVYAEGCGKVFDQIRGKSV